MGSGSSTSFSSSSSVVDLEIKFTTKNPCIHSEIYKYTKNIFLKRIPLYDSKKDKGIKAGRGILGIVTAGLSEAAYGIYKGATGAGDGANHYFIEMNFECRKCQIIPNIVKKTIAKVLNKKENEIYHPITTYTLELRDDGKKFQAGYFENSEKRDCKNGFWSYDEVKKKFDSEEMDKTYDIVNWNCGHFAKKLFKKL